MAELDVGKLSLTIEADGRAAIQELDRVRDAAEGASTDAARAYRDAGQDMADAFEPVADAAEDTAERVKNMGDEAEKTGDAVQVAGTKATRSFKDMLDSADRLGTTLTTGVTAPLIALYGTMVKGASDLTETIGKSEVVFESQADKVFAWSENAIENMGLAEASALDFASTFGDMGKGMDVPIAKATEMSMNLTQLSADLASFKNMSAERAAEALTGVYTGETEALKSLGIVMTQANLQAFALSQGITTQVSAMSQAEQVMLRYQYVMAKTADAQGDFVRTGGNLANQSRALVQTLKQAGNTFGVILTPAVTEVVSMLREGVQSIIELDEGTKTAILSIGGVVAAAGPLILAGTKIVKLVTTLRTAMTALSLGPAAIGIAAVTAGVIGLYNALDRANNKIDTTSAKYQSLKRSLSGGTLVEITANAEELDKLDGRNIEVTYSVGQAPGSDQDAWDDFYAKIDAMGWEEKHFSAFGEFTVDEATIEQANAYAEALAAAATATGEYDAAVESLNALLDEQLQAQMAQINQQVNEQARELVAMYNEGLIDDEQFNQQIEVIVAGALEAKKSLEAIAEGQKAVNEAYADGSLSNDPEAYGAAVKQIYAGETLGTEDLQGAIVALKEASQAGEDMTAHYNDALVALSQLKEQAVSDFDAMTQAQETYEQAIAAANATQQETVEANQNVLDNASLMASALKSYGEGLELFGGNAEQAISYAADQLDSNAEEFEAIRQQLTEQLTSDETGELMTRNYGEVYDTFTAMAAEAEAAIEQALTDGENARTQAAQSFASTLNDLTGDFTAAETQMIMEMIAQTGASISEADAEMIAATESMIDQMASAAGEGGTEVLDKVSEMIANVGNEKSSAASEGAEVGAAITSGITTGLSNGTSALYNAVRRIVNNAIAVAKETADINSPSRRTAKEIGAPFIQGIAAGAEDETPNAVRTIRKSVEHMISGGTQVVNTGAYTVPVMESAGAFGIDYDLMGEKLTDAVNGMNFVFRVGDTQLSKATRESNARQQAMRAHEINMGRGRVE